MITVFYDCYQVLNKVYSDGAYISQAINSTQVEPLKRREITKICYGVLDRDVELSYFISQLSEKNPKLAIRTLLKIAMYSVKHLGWQPYAVTNNVVELSKKLGKGATAGFINAFMRNFVKQNIVYPTDKFEYLSIKYSYPLFAVKLLAQTYGEDVAESIISYDKDHSFVRFDSAVNGEKYLIDNGYEFSKTVYDNFFEVKGLKINDDFNNGLFTFQTIGSVAICEQFVDCENALDACSGPGGKTVLMCEKAKNVTAFELHEHRKELVEAYLKRMGKTNAVVLQKDSSVYDENYKNKFDMVLCDVPCSGFGTLKDNPDIKLKKDLDSVLSLTRSQFDILSACSEYVKENGILIYSTCSIFKQENDNIIKKFLDKNNNFEIVKFCSKLDGLQTKFGKQFLPHLSYGAGFYVSVLKKIK